MTVSLGYRPDPRALERGDPLFRDSHAHLLGGVLPDEDDHLVEHVQGIIAQTGESCVGASLAQDLQIVLSLEGEDPVEPSGSFIWYNARESLGDQALNVGTFIYAGVQSLNDFGAPPDEDWPLADAEFKFADRPSHVAYMHGYDLKFGLQVYRVGQSEEEIKAAIHGLGPITFGTVVTRAFTETGQHSSPLGPPEPGQEVAGGHAMTAAAYDRYGVRVPNTWGATVGNAGWFYLSWEYLLSDYTSEIVVVKRVPRLVRSEP